MVVVEELLKYAHVGSNNRVITCGRSVYPKILDEIKEFSTQKGNGFLFQNMLTIEVRKSMNIPRTQFKIEDPEADDDEM
jgi:hypothetical protein